MGNSCVITSPWCNTNHSGFLDSEISFPYFSYEKTSILLRNSFFFLFSRVCFIYYYFYFILLRLHAHMLHMSVANWLNNLQHKNGLYGHCNGHASVLTQLWEKLIMENVENVADYQSHHCCWYNWPLLLHISGFLDNGALVVAGTP